MCCRSLLPTYADAEAITAYNWWLLQRTQRVDLVHVLPCRGHEERRAAVRCSHKRPAAPKPAHAVEDLTVLCGSSLID
jgi:hypothetical protein